MIDNGGVVEFKCTLGPSAKSAAMHVVLVMKNMVERHSTQAIGQINKFGFIKIQYKENETHQTNVQAIKKNTEFVLYMQVLAMETMFYICRHFQRENSIGQNIQFKT